MRGLSITKIDGEHYVRFDKTIRGNRHRFFEKCDSKGAAEKRKRALKKLIESGDFSFEEADEKPTATLTLSQYYKRFETTYLVTAVRASTARSYKQNFKNHILPELGNLPLDQITRERIQDFAAHLMSKSKRKPKSKKDEDEKIEETKLEPKPEPLSKNSIRIALAALSSLLSNAKEFGRPVSTDAIRKSGKFYKEAKNVQGKINPLSQDEVLLFLQAVKDNYPFWFPFFLTACHTGMRIGELRGLQWGDLDFAGHFIFVQRGIDEQGNVNPTKTGKDRKIDMSDAVRSTLSALKKSREQECKQKTKEMPQWVFCNAEGRPIDSRNLKERVFFRCLEKAGLRRIRFHDLRHTFASMLLANNESLHYVKEQMGHSDIRTTVNIYGHLILGSNRQAVNKLPSIEAPAASNVISMKEKAKKRA